MIKGSYLLVYIVNEQGNTVTAHRFDQQRGTLAIFQNISTLPQGYTGGGYTAHVELHPNGQWLYASNRGHDSIVGFKLAADGSLSPFGHFPVPASQLVATVRSDSSPAATADSIQKLAECLHADLANAEALYALVNERGYGGFDLPVFAQTIQFMNGAVVDYSHARRQWVRTHFVPLP